MINAGQAKMPISIVCISDVDASGKKVFDELIKMDDEGADVRHFPPTLASRRAHFRVVDLPPRDLKTRFSGIHPEEYSTHAVLVPLESVRRALNGPISADTILIGHVLDNDLRVPHLVHRRVVDTAALFSHPRGPPHGRGLRDL